ncbi:DUF1403 family protein [uncultured Roseobacter sp.]|uniref:DUF1403 family protein n=1 Tax=uncultured Roseobacter sp. TaxID=114847 RepID=UPI002619F63B|nr:DUF1403 family protein [uncultured Roseobacter sp.]
MTYAVDSFDTLPRLPSWVTSRRAETSETVAFLSGAALSHLHLVVERPDVPQSLLRERLALRAAEACVMRSGRSERAGELRDAVGFLQPGDTPGPAGEVYFNWRRAAERPVSVKTLHRALPTVSREQIAVWLDAGQGDPVGRSSAVLETVLAETPRAEATAQILADATLAQALGWNHLVPLLSARLKRGDLRKRGEDLRLSCHRSLIATSAEATLLAADLARRSARLKTVAPKLRAKGAGVALELFLSRDAVAPAALTSPGPGADMSDRAARRFCDRLVELGVVRELTGRDSFRIYGL